MYAGPALVIFAIASSVYVGAVARVSRPLSCPFIFLPTAALLSMPARADSSWNRPPIRLALCFSPSLSNHLSSGVWNEYHPSDHHPQGWTWFSYHPLAMTVAFIAMAGNSALIKKIGGKTNTEIHGYIMCAAAATAVFGWCVSTPTCWPALPRIILGTTDCILNVRLILPFFFASPPSYSPIHIYQFIHLSLCLSVSLTLRLSDSLSLCLCPHPLILATASTCPDLASTLTSSGTRIDTQVRDILQQRHVWKEAQHLVARLVGRRRLCRFLDSGTFFVPGI